VIAVGDGANDIPMLKLAGLGVAFHAKPKVLGLNGYYSGLNESYSGSMKITRAQ